MGDKNLQVRMGKQVVLWEPIAETSLLTFRFQMFWTIHYYVQCTHTTLISQSEFPKDDKKSNLVKPCGFVNSSKHFESFLEGVLGGLEKIKWLAKIFLTLWRRYLAFQRDPFRPISRWQAGQDHETPPGTLAVVLNSSERRIRWIRKRRGLPPPDEIPWISSSQVEAPCQVCTGLLQYQWCSVDKRQFEIHHPTFFQYLTLRKV